MPISMIPMELQTIAELRAIVGYLGEKEQHGWWQSSFFTSGSDAFLSPIFGRTQILAQCNGVTQAATLVHDERIGVGYVYHLFRLPEDMEQGIHQVLHDPDLGRRISSLTANKQAALEGLRIHSVASDCPGIGPIRVGDVAALRDPQAWRMVAGFYLFSFENGLQIFPYFTDFVK
jgi:hypothetical protein